MYFLFILYLKSIPVNQTMQIVDQKLNEEMEEGGSSAE
jgi:hypothetical protein